MANISLLDTGVGFPDPHRLPRGSKAPEGPGIAMVGVELIGRMR
jgi:hypothetical protein